MSTHQDARVALAERRVLRFASTWFRAYVRRAEALNSPNRHLIDLRNMAERIAQGRVLGAVGRMLQERKAGRARR